MTGVADEIHNVTANKRHTDEPASEEKKDKIQEQEVEGDSTGVAPPQTMAIGSKLPDRPDADPLDPIEIGTRVLFVLRKVLTQIKSKLNYLPHYK